MKNFFVDFWDFLTEPIEGFGDGVMRVLLWIISLVFLAFICCGLFVLIDTVGTGKKDGEGTVTGKYYHHSYVSTTYVSTGKATIPITTFHPERWSLGIKAYGSSDDITVSKGYCYSVKIGEKLKIVYKLGRLSKHLYISKIY